VKTGYVGGVDGKVDINGSEHLIAESVAIGLEFATQEGYT